ncbi:hypothetical protein HBP99_13840 [Listeria booriae]|uniref:hypothetical protein n=1 Tax=Listeria booriae TaxID=1552123 RepID=UPI0016252906|nr:hypothetical protein [Listeria booriae]MBC2369724.1 hypothetical protein [Listeria booriae]
MDYKQTHELMRKAVLIAREMEGDWKVRMRLALDSVIIDHYFSQEPTKSTIEKLLAKRVSYRKICKKFQLHRVEVNAILNG